MTAIIKTLNAEMVGAITSPQWGRLDNVAQLLEFFCESKDDNGDFIYDYTSIASNILEYLDGL